MSLEHENPSIVTALLRGSTLRDGLAIRMELETDEGVETWTLSFQAVRFFSVAHDGTRRVDDLAAYDRLIDLVHSTIRVDDILHTRGSALVGRRVHFCVVDRRHREPTWMTADPP